MRFIVLKFYTIWNKQRGVFAVRLVLGYVRLGAVCFNFEL